ncbi:hypothetical protein [Paenibacillus montanisoli]|uniref:Uncharacterized protein n=1 Tax=Paenibacillus montanisoli TaxID=2081970 RepID=A0A328U109_9BACL|nr:hypothetical protein [Paenibacillus montanisoli]RAP74545.1 hypothetical protein DL346_21010 [Paenibacillus montanisoli]
MRRWTMLVLGLIVTLFGTIGCAKQAEKPSAAELIEQYEAPPEAMAIVDNQEIKLIKGSYRWRNSIADAPAPNDLVKDGILYAVKPGATLTTDFYDLPPRTVSGGLWANQTNTPLPKQENKLLLPSEPGIYILVINASWSDDDYATYAVKLEVLAAENTADTQ